MTDTHVPEHITPKSIYEMDMEHIEALVDDLRTRRLKSVRMYEESVRIAKEASDEKARIALFKQAEMCEKNIARVDKALDALETRVNKMRVLRLELDLD